MHPLLTKNRFAVLSVDEMTKSDLISSTDSVENNVQAVPQPPSPVPTLNTISSTFEPTRECDKFNIRNRAVYRTRSPMFGHHKLYYHTEFNPRKVMASFKISEGTKVENEVATICLLETSFIPR
jgi:hypothetical protein